MHLVAKTILFAMLVGAAVGILLGPPEPQRAWPLHFSAPPMPLSIFNKFR